MDAAPSDGESDGGVATEAGSDGAPACPVCEAGTTCCLIPTSASYGKCYATSCLACCQ